jgi:hypothetical protein
VEGGIRIVLIDKRQSQAAKGKNRQQRLEEESPDYDSVHRKDVKQTDLVQDNLGGRYGENVWIVM